MAFRDRQVFDREHRQDPLMITRLRLRCLRPRSVCHYVQKFTDAVLPNGPNHSDKLRKFVRVGREFGRYHLVQFRARALEQLRARLDEPVPVDLRLQRQLFADALKQVHRVHQEFGRQLFQWRDINFSVRVAVCIA
jgi:hypothetical protein